MHLDRLIGLPDLIALARDRGGADVYAELERLKREYDTAKTPYRYSMPYRNPPRLCQSGAHAVAAVQHTLVNPARGENVTLWEAELHEAEVHGASLPAEVVAFLGRLAESDPKVSSRSTTSVSTREQLVDRAMRKHGNFGVYGDLRVGLAELLKSSTVTLTDEDRGIRVDIVPRDGNGHEYQFVVTPAGNIEDFMAGESSPAVTAVPQKLTFAFGTVRLVKHEGGITLTVVPVWSDAQTGPPPDFELGSRTYRMNAKDFQRVWAELSAMDLARYARVTDADFETAPPDLRHVESFGYSVDNRGIVLWGRPYQWLRAELRAPLLMIERQLTEWANEQPTPAPVSFAHVTLRDVEGLNGGQNVTVYSDGRVVVQRVRAAQGNKGLQERRYAWRLDAGQLAELKATLAQHPPRALGLSRPGVPGEVAVEIDVIGEDGARIAMRQWADDAQADFAALHAHLLRYTRATYKHKPMREGKYDPQWRPGSD